jgi:hypothetical protein
VLVGALGPGSAVAVDAGTFLISAFMLARLKVAPAAASGAAPNRLLTDLRQGWDEFRSRSWLWAIVAEFSIWHLLVFAPVIVLGAVVAKAHLGGAEAWGAILSAFGAGSVVGGIISLHARPRHPLRAGTFATLGFVPLPALLAAQAPVAVIAAVAAIGGAGFALFGVWWDTTLQREVPPEVLSRVSSYDWFGSVALLPVGYAIAGPLADVFTIRVTLFASTVIMLALVLGVLSVRSVHQVEGIART